MRFRATFLISATVAAFLLCSCSVKEDRAVCPCRMDIDVDEFARLEDCPTALLQIQSDKDISETIVPREYEGSCYVAKVGRRPNRVTLVGGLKSSVCRGDTLSLPVGQEADALWVYNEYVDCSDEYVFVKAVPHKRWCDVHLILAGVPDPSKYEYDIVIAADCSGMRLSSGLPVWGDYRAMVNRTKVGDPVVRLPLQKENSVRLDFYHKNDARVYESHDRAFYLEIGKEMERQHYDWRKDDLDDVYVIVNNVEMTASITVVPWKKRPIDVEI